MRARDAERPINDLRDVIKTIELMVALEADDVSQGDPNSYGPSEVRSLCRCRCRCLCRYRCLSTQAACVGSRFRPMRPLRLS